MKYGVSDLAILGGRPAFDQPLHVGCPNLGDRARFMERLNDILDQRWFTNAGRYVEEFERRIAEQVGVKHCIATCNGTIALEIVIRALQMMNEVIVPSFTFVATAHALQWQAITPRFCDIRPDTFTLDPDEVERLITPQVTGIVGVHLWGHACDVDRLEAIARKHHIALLFDAAHAFGCTYHGRPIGSFGNAEVFSFHATKFINAFEGGAIVTNDDTLARNVRYMKNFGFAGYDKVVFPGTNGKMTEVSAAMGLTSLESIDAFVAVNRRNYARYADRLGACPGLHLVPYDTTERNNYQYVVCEVDVAETGLTRNQLVSILHAEQILARRYFYPGCHRMPFYSELLFSQDLPLPVTNVKADRVLVLPTGTAVDEPAIDRICDLIYFTLAHAGAIAPRLAIAKAGTDRLPQDDNHE